MLVLLILCKTVAASICFVFKYLHSAFFTVLILTFHLPAYYDGPQSFLRNQQSLSWSRIPATHRIRKFIALLTRVLQRNLSWSQRNRVHTITLLRSILTLSSIYVSVFLHSRFTIKMLHAFFTWLHTGYIRRPYHPSWFNLTWFDLMWRKIPL
jgi:hypothetical protein